MASIVLFLGVVVVAWTLRTATRKARQEVRDATLRANNASQENATLKLKQVLKIRKKVLLHGAFQQNNIAGARSIYHTMQKGNAQANKLAACKALGRLAYRSRRGELRRPS